MAELKKIRFLLFVSLMIFPAHALDVLFSRADEDSKQKAEININIKDGAKTYDGTLSPLNYQPKPETSRVIVYIIDKSRFVEIIRNAVREMRLQIAQELMERHCELIFLGIDNFDDDEYHLISAFMADKIQSHHEGQPQFTIQTIGENHFLPFERYAENTEICGGNLIARLANFPRGAVRPVGSNGKEIRLYGYHPTVGEVSWPISVVNNTYFPRVNVSAKKYNFRIRYKRKKICLLIVGGKEYLAITSPGHYAQKAEILEHLDKMTFDKEGLFILGVFNFDWTEIFFVTQIILEHSVGLHSSDYNVFTCGYGMFNSYYMNVYVPDGRFIFQQPNSNTTEVIRMLMGGDVEQRAIIMYFFEEEWDFCEMPINSCNGRYSPENKYKNYLFPWSNEKIAFIVYASIETNNQIDLPVVLRSLRKLKGSGIRVVVIEAFYFGLDDKYLIADWIDYHRGFIDSELIIKPDQIIDSEQIIDSNQIAVLGAGIFDTIFQSKSTTYNPFFNIRKKELINIRNAYVREGNGKRIFVARVDEPVREIWTYPMNTVVNGLYEPDLIPDKNVFDSRGGKKIYFIITSAFIFHQIPAVKNMSLVAWFKGKIEKYFLSSDWSVFLVGLDNFGEQDFHLFAELVKLQTHDVRPLETIVRTFRFGLGSSTFQCKDDPPFPIEERPRIKKYLIALFGTVRRFADIGSSSQRHR